MSLSTVDLNSLIATRYMAAVAVTCSLWNHLINVDREIEFVWRPPWSFLQLLVMFNLYGGQASLIFIVYVLGDLRPPLHLSVCKAYVLFVCVYGTLSTGSTQFALLLRVYALWDNRKEIKYALITGFIICYSLSVGFAVATMQKFFNKLQYSMSLDSCFLPEKADYLIGVWGGMTLYDVYILMFVVVNVLNKPRRRDSEIVTNLIRDGALTFMGFFALRLLKLFQSIFGGAAQTFLTPIFTWAMDGILGFHLFLKVKLLEINASTRQHQHVLQKQALIVEEVEMKLM